MLHYGNAERAEVDYNQVPDWRDETSPSVEFEGQTYWLENFVRTEAAGELRAAGWDGIHDESAWSAIVIAIRYAIDDYAIIARILGY
jgi:hypothetical protein